MSQNYDYKKYAVLFVDDEPKALKLFEKALTEDFRVLTASGVAEAWKIVESEGENLGIVITDQRMPEETGVDLLRRIKSHRPNVIRILTTAYSDLDSAIAAVNAGGAFQYITKPWKLPHLEMALRRAMEYFLVCRERDSLLEEKLYVLQRMLIMDRVRGLAALAAAVEHRFQNAIGALKSYVSQARTPAGIMERDDMSQLDLWSLARTEGESLVNAVREVLQGASPASSGFEDDLDVEQVMRRFIGKTQEKKAEDGVSFQITIAPDLPAISGEPALLERLMEILVNRISDMDGEDRNVTICVSAADTPEGSPGVKLQITSDGPDWEDRQLASLYSAVIAKHAWPMGIDMDVLSAFFIAHHHGGSVEVHQAAPSGPGFGVILSCNPKVARQDKIDADWFDEIFSSLEERDELSTF